MQYEYSLLERARAVVGIEMFDRSYDEMVCGLELPVLFVDGPNKRSGDSLPADQLYMENTIDLRRGPVRSSQRLSDVQCPPRLLL